MPHITEDSAELKELLGIKTNSFLHNETPAAFFAGICEYVELVLKSPLLSSIIVNEVKSSEEREQEQFARDLEVYAQKITIIGNVLLELLTPLRKELPQKLKEMVQEIEWIMTLDHRDASNIQHSFGVLTDAIRILRSTSYQWITKASPKINSQRFFKAREDFEEDRQEQIWGVWNCLEDAYRGGWAKTANRKQFAMPKRYIPEYSEVLKREYVSAVTTHSEERKITYANRFKIADYRIYIERMNSFFEERLQNLKSNTVQQPTESAVELPQIITVKDLEIGVQIDKKHFKDSLVQFVENQEGGRKHVRKGLHKILLLLLWHGEVHRWMTQKEIKQKTRVKNISRAISSLRDLFSDTRKGQVFEYDVVKDAYRLNSVKPFRKKLNGIAL